MIGRLADGTAIDIPARLIDRVAAGHIAAITADLDLAAMAPLIAAMTGG